MSGIKPTIEFQILLHPVSILRNDRHIPPYVT